MELFLNDSLGQITLEVEEADNARAVIIIAHGAGAGMHHPFMTSISGLFVARGFHVARFNFPYMESGKKFPGAPKPNIETWGLVIDYLCVTYPDLPIIISGKSYGGRMASHLLADQSPAAVKGIFYLGFPLHAPGKNSKARATHLNAVQVPQLFLQGINDQLANIDLMREVLSSLPAARMLEVEFADHSFKVPKASGRTSKEVMHQLVEVTTEWIDTVLK